MQRNEFAPSTPARDMLMGMHSIIDLLIVEESPPKVMMLLIEAVRIEARQLYIEAFDKKFESCGILYVDSISAN